MTYEEGMQIAATAANTPGKFAELCPECDQPMLPPGETQAEERVRPRQRMPARTRMRAERLVPAREEGGEGRRTMKLGKMIAILEQCCPGSKVYYDFCEMRPSGRIDSYRGYYDQLALGWLDEGNDITVGELLSVLRHAVGATFTGYKGGDYRMDASTEVWVDNVGRATSTRVSRIDISNDDEKYGSITICTESE